MLVDCLPSPYRFFGLSHSLTLQRSESLKQSSALCQEHKRINYPSNISDEKLTTATLHFIEFISMPTSMYTQFSVLRMQVTMQISLLRNCVNVKMQKFPQHAGFVSMAPQHKKKILNIFFQMESLHHPYSNNLILIFKSIEG